MEQSYNSATRELRALSKQLEIAREQAEKMDTNFAQALKLAAEAADKSAHALVDFETAIKLRTQFLIRLQKKLEEREQPRPG